MIFYRYIRPTRFDPKRVDLQTYARGGVCLRFEQHPDGTLWFAHSRCHPDELFSKDIARKIADQRAASLDPLFRIEMQVPNLKSVHDSVQAVIQWCHAWEPAPYPPVVPYMVQEIRQLGHALQEIVNVNEQEQQKHDDWVTIQAAANYQNDYDRLGR